jgi:thymidylate synthase (FAD)
MDAHAQYEIRAFADVVAEITRDWVPFAYEAFADYRLGGADLSRQEMEVLRRAVRGEEIGPLIEAADLSGREKNELRRKLGLPLVRRRSGHPV